MFRNGQLLNGVFLTASTDPVFYQKRLLTGPLYRKKTFIFQNQSEKILYLILHIMRDYGYTESIQPGLTVLLTGREKVLSDQLPSEILHGRILSISKEMTAYPMQIMINSC